MQNHEINVKMLDQIARSLFIILVRTLLEFCCAPGSSSEGKSKARYLRIF